MTTDHENENRSDDHADANSHGAKQRPSYDDVNVPVVVLVGVISMVLTFVTIWFVEGVYYQWKNNLVLERSYEIENTIQSETIASQTRILDGVEEKKITSLDSVIDDIVGKFKNEHDSHAEEGNVGEPHDDGEDGH